MQLCQVKYQHIHRDSSKECIQDHHKHDHHVSPEVLVGPLDPEHIAAAVVLVQLRLNQRPVQVLGGSELKLWQLAGGQVSVQKNRSDLLFISLCKNGRIL